MSNEIPEPIGRARLGRALLQGFRAAYDNLGYVVLVSFVSFALTAWPVAYGISAAVRTSPRWAALAVGGVCLCYFCAVGVFFYANRAVYHEHPTLADTLGGIRVLFVPAVSLLFLDLAITAVLSGDAVFFLLRAGNPVFMILGVVSGYLTLVWLLMAMYHLPLLPAQLKMESGPKPFVIIRKSFLLLADNPGFTVGVFLVIIALAVVCVPALVGAALLFLGASAFILTHALRELFIKYGIVEEEPEVSHDDGWRLPDSWRRRGGPDDDTRGGG